jgi:hypothetical protein
MAYLHYTIHGDPQAVMPDALQNTILVHLDNEGIHSATVVGKRVNAEPGVQCFRPQILAARLALLIQLGAVSMIGCAILPRCRKLRRIQTNVCGFQYFVVGETGSVTDPS